MNLDGIDVFVKVIQAGSFSRAAQLLNMPVTTVSGKVASLEKRLGVTLIQRTTRKLHITQAGEAYFKRCIRALEEMESAEQELATSKAEPEGLLRITAPVDAGHAYLPSLVNEYLKAHPKMRVDMIVTNRFVDLIGEGVDLALRVGGMKDSTLITRKFVDTHANVWATPAYIRKHGAPKSVNDLKNHEFITFTPQKDLTKFMRGGEETELRLRSRISADDFETVKACVLQGEAVGLIPTFLCESEEKSGKLIKVLPQWCWGAFSLSFVYPAQRFVPPKVQSFIAWAVKNVK